MYKELGKIIAKSKRLFVFTGSGISVPSSIPCYSGPKGLWETPPTKILDPMGKLTKLRMDFNQKPIWNWVRAYRSFLIDAKPNPAHKAILKLQEHFKKIGRELTLATQCLDGIHAKLMNSSKILTPNGPKKEGENLYGYQDNLIELHGNLNYMTCLEECHPGLHPISETLKQDEVPVCPECGEPMRPHFLLYDEYYSEYRHRSDTMTKKSMQADCMLVIAMSLKTQLPSALVYEHIDEGKITVEINTEKTIKINWEDAANLKNLHYVTKPCEEALPLLVDEIISNTS